MKSEKPNEWSFDEDEERRSPLAEGFEPDQIERMPEMIATRHREAVGVVGVNSFVLVESGRDAVQIDQAEDRAGKHGEKNERPWPDRRSKHPGHDDVVLAAAPASERDAASIQLRRDGRISVARLKHGSRTRRRRLPKPLTLPPAFRITNRMRLA